MPKIGHSLEKLVAYFDRPNLSDESYQLLKKMGVSAKFERTSTTQTYTIECPHCKRFFEFNLEVKR